MVHVPEPKASIDVATDGPYRVRGVEALRNSRGESLPLKDIVALCRCGGSANKPFCDGTHARNGFSGAAAPDDGKRRQRDYAAPGGTVHDRRWICSHAAECARGMPEVFRQNAKPWIVPDAAALERIREVVRRCPSGALTVSMGGIEELAPPAPRPPAIDVEKNGPYRVTGGPPLQDPSGVQPPVAEHYTLCRCGKSRNKPFCDGSHRDGFVDEAS